EGVDDRVADDVAPDALGLARLGERLQPLALAFARHGALGSGVERGACRIGERRLRRIGTDAEQRGDLGTVTVGERVRDGEARRAARACIEVKQDRANLGHRPRRQAPARLATGEYMSSSCSRVARSRSDTTPISRSRNALPNSGSLPNAARRSSPSIASAVTRSSARAWKCLAWCRRTADQSKTS